MISDEILAVVEAIRAGARDEFGRLVELLKTATGGAPEAILELLNSTESILRRAAISLACVSTDDRVLQRVADIAADRDAMVRFGLAEAIQSHSTWQNLAVVEQLLNDSDGDVRRVAAAICAQRGVFHDRLLRLLQNDDNWRVRENAAAGLRDAPSTDVLGPLVERIGLDSDADVARICAQTAEYHLQNFAGALDWLRPNVALANQAMAAVQANSAYGLRRLGEWLKKYCAEHVDAEQLEKFGTVLTRPSELSNLPRSHLQEEYVTILRQAIEQRQSVALLGDSGVGKTAAVYELAHRLSAENPPWHVLQMTPADFMTGTHYLGEWETRLNDLLAAIRVPKRVVLYVPNFSELLWVGRSSNSSVNVAMSLVPHIERGELRLIGEGTGEAFQTGLGSVASLARAFRTVKMLPADAPATQQIVEAVAAESNRELPLPLIHRLLDLAEYYGGSAVLPGRALLVLRRLLSEIRETHRSVDVRDILNAIHESTGMPTDLLDDEIPLQAREVRSFFEERVMGQPEAVDAAVDLVTLIKARLTDPSKPFGVLLFVGPTGVGKTELARAMAEYCFGDANRLTRFDMSEFASYESYERLIGRGAQPGLLTSVVNERPFSIILLDEIEKGHPNVFDLCLQIFDAGRLTDGQGKKADFRHTVIILTSNVGNSAPMSPSIGFSGSEKTGHSPTAPHRDLFQAFRPEFLNRIDRIVHFRPLSQETAERIARREVQRVLQRSGIRQRNLIVEIDPGLLVPLLNEGYSPTFGARPLKRTVERMVLQPLARSIACGELRDGSVVRLAMRNGSVRVDIVVADQPEREKPLSPPSKITTLRSEARQLETRCAGLREQAASLSRIKSTMLSRMAESRFWDNAEEAQRVSDHIYRCDTVLSRLEELSDAVRVFAESLCQQDVPRGSAPRIQDRLRGLEVEIAQFEYLASNRDPKYLGDAVLMLNKVGSRGKRLDGVEKLARMYIALAARHKYEVQVLDDSQPDSGEDNIALRIDGAGAYSLLARECGLHQLNRGDADREIVRVRCVLLDPCLPRLDADIESRPLKKCRSRIIERKHEVTVVDRTTGESFAAWTAAFDDKTGDPLAPLILARREMLRQTAEATVVRKYRLGPNRFVKDLRTGLRSGRVDAILKDGELDAFLIPLGSDQNTSPAEGVSQR
jgi:ATP-dependent Clp protease ATP-binding subunit ClpA/protein subunit release factor A